MVKSNNVTSPMIDPSNLTSVSPQLDVSWQLNKYINLSINH